MSIITRRSLIRGSATTAAGALIYPTLQRTERDRELSNSLIGQKDPKHKQLIEAAVSAAKSAGADYADARLSFNEYFNNLNQQYSHLGFGVRALVGGYWGFAASPIWNVTEAARLGQAAVASAKANVLGRPRDMILAENKLGESGDWIMPVKDDPFEMSRDEINDFCRGLQNYIRRKPKNTIGLAGYEFHRQSKIFGSSDGQFTTQRIYQTHFGVSVEVIDGPSRMKDFVDQVSIAGMGFEYARDQPLRRYIDEVYEDIVERLKLPIVPVDVGKYRVLLDASGVSTCINHSIGFATEIDRAMGFEANANGTSYITDPDSMLGTLKLGSPAWNISASRTIPGGCGTVRWDDEGIAPKDFNLVRDGILVDMQTNREGYGWLQSYYERNNMPPVSNGCAYSAYATNPALVRCADLIVKPDSSSSYTMDALRSEIDEGVEFRKPIVSFDFQMSTAMLWAGGDAFKIKNGKRVARIAGAGMLFRTSELMENLVQLGGPSTVIGFGGTNEKGEPKQNSVNSVYSPPAVFKDMTMIDIMRKA